jgi:4-carboxymuconolactone decarboxylase
MPRMTPLPDPLDARQQILYERIASGPRGRVAGPLAMWLRSPNLCEHAQALGEYLRFETVFPKQLSEMGILLTAAHRKCAHEWIVHAPIAEREGLESEIIEAIRVGRQPAAMHDEMEAFYDFVIGLLVRNRIADAVYYRFVAAFGEVGVVEVTALMGYYEIGAHLLNAVEYGLEQGRGPFHL